MSTWSTTLVYDKIGRQNIAFEAHQGPLTTFKHDMDLARAPEEFEISDGANQLFRPFWEPEIQQLDIMPFVEARNTFHLCLY